MVVLLLRRAARRGHSCPWDGASATFSTPGSVLSSRTCFWRAEHLSGNPLWHDHPPRLQHQLAHLVRVERIEPCLNPVEAQLRLAWEEEHVRARRHQCGPFLLREGEADLGLVPAERDVHDLTDPELHPIPHQHLGAARQTREHPSDVVDRDHASILA